MNSKFQFCPYRRSQSAPLHVSHRRPHTNPKRCPRATPPSAQVVALVSGLALIGGRTFCAQQSARMVPITPTSTAATNQTGGGMAAFSVLEPIDSLAMAGQ